MATPVPPYPFLNAANYGAPPIIDPVTGQPITVIGNVPGTNLPSRNAPTGPIDVTPTRPFQPVKGVTDVPPVVAGPPDGGIRTGGNQGGWPVAELPPRIVGPQPLPGGGTVNLPGNGGRPVTYPLPRGGTPVGRARPIIGPNYPTGGGPTTGGSLVGEGFGTTTWVNIGVTVIEQVFGSFQSCESFKQALLDGAAAGIKGSNDVRNTARELAGKITDIYDQYGDSRHSGTPPYSPSCLAQLEALLRVLRDIVSQMTSLNGQLTTLENNVKGTNCLTGGYTLPNAQDKINLIIGQINDAADKLRATADELNQLLIDIANGRCDLPGAPRRTSSGGLVLPPWF
jgi:hypothetical protein